MVLVIAFFGAGLASGQGMKQLLQICLRTTIVIVLLTQLSYSAPWRRTTRGWEKATWLADDVVVAKSTEPIARTGDTPIAWRLHPAVLATLQLGASLAALISLDRSSRISRE